MDPFVKHLIRKGEGPEVEFKRTLHSEYKLAKTLSAFANARGGYLLVGVNDNKTLFPIKPEEEVFMLERVSEFRIKPPVNIHVSVFEDEGESVLVVNIPESDNKPHIITDDKNERKIYVRVGDQCLLAGEAAIKAMRNEKRRVVPQLNFSNNERLLFDYLKKKKRITVRDYAKLVNISKRRAERILIELVNKGEILELYYDKESYFSLA